MPTLDWPGVMRPGQFGPIKRTLPLIVLEIAANTNHVMDRDMFSNADDEFDARGHRLQNGIGATRSRHENDRRIGACLLNRLAYRIENRHSLSLRPPLPGRVPPTTFVP